MSLRKGLLLSLLALCVLPAPAAAQGLPDADIVGVQSLDATSVEVLGRINPAGTETQYRVQYGLDSSAWCQSDGATGTALETPTDTLSQTGNTYFVVSIELDALT